MSSAVITSARAFGHYDETVENVDITSPFLNTNCAPLHIKKKKVKSIKSFKPKAGSTSVNIKKPTISR